MLAVALGVWPCAVAAQGRPTEAADYGRISSAVEAAVAYLKGKIDANGCCVDEFPAADRQYGGRTALCAYALASAGVQHTDPVLSRTLEWLQQAELSSTYAVAMRACALASVREPNVLPRLTADVRWLIEAAGKGGAYTYTPLRGKPAESFDNCNAQAAMMAVAAGEARGVEVPPAYWQLMERYWLDQQQVDGGWGYRTLPGVRKVKTYGSMTAAGLASLYLCFDRVHRADFVQCKAPAYEPIDKGLAWIAKRFAPGANPGIGDNWYYYYLHCLGRAGLAGGRKYFGSRDWYAEGVAELLETRSDEGRWGYGGGIRETCFALLFLAGGRHPVAFNKLQYPGRWNSRPRDVANLTQWLRLTFERPLGWQIVDANSPLRDLQETPVLYISGAGLMELSREQVDRLRAYVLRGGMIVSEAACNTGDFTLDVRRLTMRLFPQYPLERLGDDHPVYSAHFMTKTKVGLMGVSNGVRLLVIHAPRELSLGLQMGPTELNMPWYELAANIYFQATDKLPLKPRGSRAWPPAEPFEPLATIRVARISHKGNCDPEPLAWRRLSILMGRRHRVKLEVTGPMDISRLSAAKWPVAAMTGTDDPRLTAEDMKALRTYLMDGGTLIIDAAGGSRRFGQWAERNILPLLPQPTAGPIHPKHRLYQSPAVVEKVRYRRGYALALGTRATDPGLIGVQVGDRLAVIYSADDLSSAMVGYDGYNVRGYGPASAVRLMANIVCYAAKVKLPTSATAAGTP